MRFLPKILVVLASTCAEVPEGDTRVFEVAGPPDANIPSESGNLPSDFRGDEGAVGEDITIAAAIPMALTAFIDHSDNLQKQVGAIADRAVPPTVSAADYRMMPTMTWDEARPRLEQMPDFAKERTRDGLDQAGKFASELKAKLEPALAQLKDIPFQTIEVGNMVLTVRKAKGKFSADLAVDGQLIRLESGSAGTKPYGETTLWHKGVVNLKSVDVVAKVDPIAATLNFDDFGSGTDEVKFAVLTAPNVQTPVGITGSVVAITGEYKYPAGTPAAMTPYNANEYTVLGAFIPGDNVGALTASQQQQIQVFVAKEFDSVGKRIATSANEYWNLDFAAVGLANSSLLSWYLLEHLRKHFPLLNDILDRMAKELAQAVPMPEWVTTKPTTTITSTSTSPITTVAPTTVTTTTLPSTTLLPITSPPSETQPPTTKAPAETTTTINTEEATTTTVASESTDATTLSSTSTTTSSTTTTTTSSTTTTSLTTTTILTTTTTLTPKTMPPTMPPPTAPTSSVTMPTLAPPSSSTEPPPTDPPPTMPPPLSLPTTTTTSEIETTTTGGQILHDLTTSTQPGSGGE